MRYTHPEAETSKELSAWLPGAALGEELSDDFRFAAATASFGMLLRDSPFKGVMTYAGVLEEAAGSVGKDAGGHRKELLELVKKARDLTAKPKADASPAHLAAGNKTPGGGIMSPITSLDKFRSHILWSESIVSQKLLCAALGGLCLFVVGCGGASGPPPAGGRLETGGRAIPQADGAIAKPPAPLPTTEANPNKAKAEAYAPITENAFRAVMDAPLSTFSADVNTAAYSNVRRFLNSGQLPPRDAVFLAEMVNYFPYRYPNAAGDAPVAMILDMAACPWKPDHRLVRIGVRAKSIEPTEMPRRNLVFLVDVSGSMSPENRLPLVKQSLDYLIDQLTPQDKVSIVTYASGSEVRLRPTGGDQKEAIRAAVHSLRAGGGTLGSGGIKLAYEVARGSFIEGGANRIILCTDGDFNLGQTSESELQQLVERERISRVFLTVLGFGMGNLKNQTMELLANHGNGHYAYIDSQEEARKVFVEQGGALVCVAKDVKFQLEFNPKRVGAYRLLGYENRLLANEDFKNDAKDAGDMGSGHTVTALYEVVPVGVKIDIPGVDPLKYQTPPQPAGTSDEWLTVKMRYKSPEGDTSKELATPLPATAGGGPMNEDFAFAAAVAEFALVLRESPYKGSANLADVLKRAEASSSHDPNGHRKEFIDLVKKAMAAGKAKE